MNLANTLEDHIPIRSAEIRGCAETRDGITIGIGIVDHDVRRVVDLDLRGEVGVDLDVVVHILSLDGEEERTEPFEGTEITADPEEIDFPETGLLLGVVHAVPY